MGKLVRAFPSSRSIGHNNNFDTKKQANRPYGLKNYDARLKLTKRNDERAFVRKIKDARQLLDRSNDSRSLFSLNEYEQNNYGTMRPQTAAQLTNEPDGMSADDEHLNDDYATYTASLKRKSQEPIMIVTGLGNVRKDGDKLRVVSGSQHHVISKGPNTLVTLKNDKLKQPDLKAIGPIKIKIENNQYESSSNMTDSSDTERQSNRSNTNQGMIYSSSRSLHDGYRHQNNDSHHHHHHHNRQQHQHENNRYHHNETNRYHENEHRSAHNSNQSSSIRSRLEPSARHSFSNDAMDCDNDYETSKSVSRFSNSNNGYQSHRNAQQTYQQRSNEAHDRFSASSSRSSKSKADGHKIIISNLHSKVSEEDLMELFSDIGPIKNARFIGNGVAEVVYVSLDDALASIDRYDRKELDGYQMRIELIAKPVERESYHENAQNTRVKPSSLSSSSNPTSRTLSSNANDSMSTITGKDSLSNRFKAYSSNNTKLSSEYLASSQLNVNSSTGTKSDSNKVNHIEPSIIHQVLFDKKTPLTVTNPVTFTVKL